MAREIALAGIGGTLELNDDGEFVYTKSGFDAEVLTPEQALGRWPAAERQIREALAALD
jgi:hypothetical protein